MILFAGIPTEPPMALAIESAERQGISYVVWNQRRSPFCDLLVEMHSGEPQGRMWLDEKLWPLAEFSGIYTRTVDPRTLPENHLHGRGKDNPRQFAHSVFLHDLFNDWLEVATGRIINRPSAMASNVSKPFQAQLILIGGFKTPPTLVTNDPKQLRDFHARYGRIIYKSISSVRSIVLEWRPDQTHDIEKLRLLPTQFQAFVPGDNVRVHVIGDAVFATLIASEAVDYRYSARDGLYARLEATTLPSDVEDRCRKLTAMLGLAFAGIDLKRTPDGEWYCFEVNTSPGYSFFQEQTNQPIADALISYVIGR